MIALVKLADKRDAMILDHVNARDDQLSREDARVLCKVTPSKGCPSWPSLNTLHHLDDQCFWYAWDGRPLCLPISHRLDCKEKRCLGFSIIPVIPGDFWGTPDYCNRWTNWISKRKSTADNKHAESGLWECTLSCGWLIKKQIDRGYLPSP